MSVPRRIRELLQEAGPMTAREVAEDLGIEVDHARAAISRMHGSTLRICAYRRDTDGGRLYPRPVYAMEAGVDAKPPRRLSRTEYNRRYRARTRGMVNSVFNLAGNSAERRIGPATGVA